MPQAAPVKILPRKAVCALLGVSVATLKRWQTHDPEFPAPLALGPSRVGYRSDAVAQYQTVMQQRGATRAAAPHDPKRAGIASAARHRRAAVCAARAAKAAEVA